MTDENEPDNSDENDPFDDPFSGLFRNDDGDDDTDGTDDGDDTRPETEDDETDFIPADDADGESLEELWNDTDDDTEIPEETPVIEVGSESESESNDSDSDDGTRTASQRLLETIRSAFGAFIAFLFSIPTRASSGVSQLRNAASWLRNLPGRAVDKLKLWLLGPADTVGTRIGSAVLVLSAALVAVGALTAFTQGLEMSGNSSWFMGRLLGIATSLWTYAVVVLLFVAIVQYTQRRRAADRAASKTGFSARTCLRLAAEAKTVDGTTTIVASPVDSVSSSAMRILEAFDQPTTFIDDHDAEDEHTIDEDVVDAAAQSADAADVTDLVVHERANMSAGDHVRLTQLELVSAVDSRDLFWNLVMPALATFVAGVILVQIWVSLWVYALLAIAGLIVGTARYLFAHWRRRSHVRSLREPEHVESYDDIAILVKRVDSADVTCYYGWVGGKVYADYDPVALAWTLSEVAHAQIEGEPVPPVIQRKFARNLKQFVPNLESYRDTEYKEIMDVLVREVAESQTPPPKNKLADRVIRQDRERIGGVGYDPRIVADAYTDLVPCALVEEEVELETSTGTETITAVKIRTDEKPPEVIQTLAASSTAYNAGHSPDFELPDVTMTTDAV